MSVIPVLSRGSYAAGILRAELLQTLISALHKGRGHSKSEGSGRYDWDIAAPATHLRRNAAAPKSVGLQGAGAANPAHNQASTKQPWSAASGVLVMSPRRAAARS